MRNPLPYLALAASLVALPLAAKPAPTPPPAKAVEQTSAATARPVRPRFSDQQREMVHAFYREQRRAEDDARRAEAERSAQAQRGGGKDAGKDKGKPGKEKAMPPGIAQNLARGKTLPPGIAKTRLPDALAAKLPPPPAGHEIAVVDDRVLLIETATQTIRDRIGVAVRREGRRLDEARRRGADDADSDDERAKD